MKQTAESQNRKLLVYIQEAYEYVKTQSDEAIHGSPKYIQERLSEVFQQRISSVLDIPVEDDPQQEDDFADTQDKINTLLDQDRSDIVNLDEKFKWEGQFNPDFQEDLLRDFNNDTEQLGQLGTDAYATYLPIHFFFDAPQRALGWGVYISEYGMMKLAARLRKIYIDSFGDPPLETDKFPNGKDHLFVEMAYEVLLRHELHHFKIESFALNAQLYLRRPLYTPYLTEVYVHSFPKVDCLEEALANNSVLNSTRIGKIFRFLYPKSGANQWQQGVKKGFFDHQTLPCYLNYELSDGWKKQDAASGRSPQSQAMNYLCNQIIQTEIRPQQQVPYFAFPPNNLFLRQDNLVPIYMVSNLNDDDSFIRMPSPPQTLWKQFLKQMRYYPTGNGKGDHEQWRSECRNLPTLTVNYKGKELEYGSLKSSLRSLGISRNDFQKWKVTDKLPPQIELRMQGC